MHVYRKRGGSAADVYVLFYRPLYAPHSLCVTL